MGLRKRSSESLHSEASPHLEDMVELQSTSFVGTVQYMAPETVLGGIQSESLDWWALGIVMYQMFFDKFPFEGDSQNAIFDKIVHKDKVTIPPKTKTGPLSKHAKDLLGKFLIKDRQSRICSKCGISELKDHPFFGGVRWDDMESSKPPFKLKAKSMQDFNPKTIDGGDFANFDWFERTASGSGEQSASSTGISNGALGGESSSNVPISYNFAYTCKE